VLRWLHEKRSKVNLQTNAKKQLYFPNVLREATDANNDDESGNNENDVDESEDGFNVDEPLVSKKSKFDMDKKPRSF